MLLNQINPNSRISQNYSSSESEEDYSQEASLVLEGTNLLDWIWLDAVQQRLGITDKIARWEDTSVSCSLCSETGAWDNRVKYIETVVNDVLEDCKQEDGLSIVSMGAGELLMEFIIGKALIEYGFKKISFFLIEPRHHFENKDNEETKKLLREFRELISSVYEEKWKEPFPEDRIHYLPRAHDLEKFFEENTNVALLECLPPDEEIFNLRFKHKLPSSNETFSFSAQVPREEANSIALIPTAITDLFKKTGRQQNEPPFIVLNEANTKSKYGLEWGCKIQSENYLKYSVALYGCEKYLKEMVDFEKILNKKAKKKFKNKNFNKSICLFSKHYRHENAFDKAVNQFRIDKAVKQIKDKIVNQIENKLDQQIKLFKNSGGFEKLTQEQTTVLLEIARKEFAELEKLNIPCKPFYLADYSEDRERLISFFFYEETWRPYARHFTLQADNENVYSIDMQLL